jgi:hypothetical protein
VVRTARYLLMAFFVLALGVPGQAQGPAMAKVTGWAADALSVPVFRHDGSPLARADLRGEAVAGLREWLPDYDLVKLTRDARDDRWVQARYLKLVFCDRSNNGPEVVVGGRAQNNRAMSFGSGGSCGP